MKQTRLVSTKEGILQQASEVSISSSDKQVYDFAFFSANLNHFLPEVPYEQHKSLFTQSLIHQSLNPLNIDLGIVKISADRSGSLDAGSSPSIIATFHTGAYRALNKWLAQQGIPHALIVSENVLREQGESFVQVVRDTNPDALFELINAEDPAALFKMRHRLKSGYHIVVFADGNDGIKSNNPKQLLTLDFLEGKLNVRKGIGYLAWLTKVPIVPVFSGWLADGRLELEVKKSILPCTALVREEFVHRSMVHLYQELAFFVQRNIPQWEGWYYVHQDMSIDNEEGGLNHLTFDPHLFLPFKINNHCFILHKKSYLSYSVSERTYLKYLDVIFKENVN